MNMDGHQIWMNECAKINFDAKPRRYKEGTRTSEDAARQLQCDVSNIAKSIVFEGEEVAIVVITSGSNRVDRKKKLKKILGYKPGQATPEYVLESTGYEVGGVPPFGHLKETIKIIDEDLFKYNLIWGAGGTADTVFPITPEKLKEISKADIRDVKQ
jgi:prolyl-tRNA editing enzyme YbaK/EbsC (Cys-tRNA(Pro) deacylase)|tara:strand:- start:721 stop:1191 length:471 start_codon:yes stop_codon:yes gene_type:complete